MFFFFFQAEDGIRDGTVTGVQTCALPIFRVPDDDLLGDPGEVDADHRGDEGELGDEVTGGRAVDGVADRSEERRVGKECRSRWWQVGLEKKVKDADESHRVNW